MQKLQHSKVWFKTGATRGIGLSLARQALANDVVAATSRTLDSLHQAFGEDNARLMMLEVDLRCEASVQAAVEKTITTFGRLTE